jgi:hypothetical protein
MKLLVHERLLLLEMLPKAGNLTTIKLLRVAKEDLSFNDKENKALKFVQEEGMLNWDPAAGDIEKEIEIGEIITELIITELKRMNEDKELTEQHISLYEKFIG